MARLLVEVEPGRAEEVKRALRALGVRVVKQALNYVSVEAPPHLAARIEAIPGVVRVVEERVYRVAVYNPIPVEARLRQFLRLGGPLSPAALMWAAATAVGKERWPTGASRRAIGADEADRLGVTGRGVRVAVLDTGYDPAVAAQKVRVAYMDSTLEGDPLPTDLNGHGTWCVTAIAGPRFPTPWGPLEGVARGATIASIKTLGYGLGTARTVDVIEAIVNAYAWGAKVVSMSLGADIGPGKRHDTRECPLCSLVNTLSERGIIFVVAAGNSGEGYASCPGAAENAVTVAAVDKAFRRARFSSYGHPDYTSRGKPETAAPGVYTGASSTGLIASMEWVDGPGVAFISGTCITKDTVIYTPDGPAELKDLKIGDELWTVDLENMTPVKGRVVNIIDQGVKDVYLVRTRDGREFYATDNHPVLAIKAGGSGYRKLYWKRVGELTRNDALALVAPGENPEPILNEVITVDIARALGYFLADGWVTRSRRNWQICTAPDGGWFFETLGIPYAPYEKGRWLYAYSKRLGLALTLLGLKQDHATARLPKWVYHLTKDKIRAFIDGFARGDGNVDRTGGYRIELASEHLVKELKYLCDWAEYKAFDVKHRERVIKPPSSKEPRVSRTWQIYINPTYYGEMVYVEAVEPMGQDRVYDITVTPYPWFISQGLVLHNSMATPHISGLVALWLEYGRSRGYELTYREVKEILAVYGGSWNPETGYGVPRFEWVVDYLR